MASKTLKLKYEDNTFATVVRPHDCWSFEKLQKVIKTKTTLIFPDECHLRVFNGSGNKIQEKLIFSKQSLKSVLDQLDNKKIEAIIHRGNDHYNNASMKRSDDYQCIISYKGNDNSRQFCFTWYKGEDFDIDDFVDDMVNAIQGEIDFGDSNIVIDNINDIFETLEVYYCHPSMIDSNEINEKKSKDEFDDLMVNLNEDENIQNVHFVLKKVELTIICYLFFDLYLQPVLVFFFGCIEICFRRPNYC